MKPPSKTLSKPAAKAAGKPATASTTRPATPSAKRVSRPAPKGRAPAETAEPGPFLRFHHSEALREKTLRILSALEDGPDPTQHRDALADLVAELTNAGMDFYFIKQLKVAKAGFIVQQSANLGMAGAMQIMGRVIRNIIGRMDDAQLLSVCGSIRQLSR
ncbi:MAG: hypothetical protein ABI790_18970 [Betaproteobacteria bacterium]